MDKKQQLIATTLTNSAIEQLEALKFDPDRCRPSNTKKALEDIAGIVNYLAEMDFHIAGKKATSGRSIMAQQDEAIKIRGQDRTNMLDELVAKADKSILAAAMAGLPTSHATPHADRQREILGFVLTPQIKRSMDNAAIEEAEKAAFIKESSTLPPRYDYILHTGNTQPAETFRKKVQCILADGFLVTDDADDIDWSLTGIHPSCVVTKFRIVE